MDVRVLEYLMMIEQEKSISKAAEKVHISQSALSQCLAKIEKELDSPIFVRVNRQLVPTHIGRIYLNGAKEMLDVKHDVYEKIRNLADQSESILKIAVDVQVYQPLMEMVLPHLQKEFPQTRFGVLVVDSLLARQYLMNHIADAGFLCMKNNSNSLLLTHPLYMEQLVWAVPDNYAAMFKGWADSTAKEQLPFIYPQNGTYFRSVFDSVLSKARLIPGTCYEAEDLNGVKQLMEQGYGITLLPGRMIDLHGPYKALPLNPPYNYHVVSAMPKYTHAAAVPELDRLFSIAADCMVRDA